MDKTTSSSHLAQLGELQYQVNWSAHLSRLALNKAIGNSGILENKLVGVQKQLEQRTEQLEGVKMDMEKLVGQNEELREENAELRNKQTDLMRRRSNMVGLALQEYSPQALLCRQRVKEGHNELQYPPQLRLVTMELLSNGSSARCVLQHLRTAAHLFRPEWKEGTDYELTGEDWVRNIRRDLLPFTSILASVVVGLCKSLKQLGHDGSSLDYIDTFAVSAVLEMWDVLKDELGAVDSTLDLVLAASALPVEL
jgi:hypothetical protein